MYCRGLLELLLLHLHVVPRILLLAAELFLILALLAGLPLLEQARLEGLVLLEQPLRLLLPSLVVALGDQLALAL